MALPRKFVFGTLLLLQLSALLGQTRAAAPWSFRGNYGFLDFYRFMRNSNFEWSDCGNGSLPLSITKFLLAPDPVKVPGIATVSFNSKLSRGVNAPLRVEVVLEKKVGYQWYKIQCMDNIGSCTYNDICPYLEKVTCDRENRLDISCHCPFKKGSYDLAETKLSIDDTMVHLPWSLVRGDYKLQAEASDRDGRVACFRINFKLA